jgi:type I restriction enzyme, R subunit
MMPWYALIQIPSGKKGRVPTNGSLFFTIFQTFMSGPPKDGRPSPYFGDYPRTFSILSSLTNATGAAPTMRATGGAFWIIFPLPCIWALTATPKRKDNVDTYAYFGEPVFIYSLKDGINDGFLTPFRVKQIATTLDEYVYTSDDTVVEGEIEVGPAIRGNDFNKIIEIKEREKKAGRNFHVPDRPAGKDPGVLCHPEPCPGCARSYQSDENSTDPNYCQRVTANDGKLGRTTSAGLSGQRKDHSHDFDHITKAFNRC